MRCRCRMLFDPDEAHGRTQTREQSARSNGICLATVTNTVTKYISGLQKRLWVYPGRRSPGIHGLDGGCPRCIGALMTKASGRLHGGKALPAPGRSQGTAVNDFREWPFNGFRIYPERSCQHICFCRTTWQDISCKRTGTSHSRWPGGGNHVSILCISFILANRWSMSAQEAHENRVTIKS